MKLHLQTIFIIILASIPSKAQDFDSYKQTVQSRFDSYKSQKEKEFSDYRAKANAEFVEYVRQTWEKFNSNAPVRKPEKEPYVPPVILPELDDDIDIPDEEIDIPDIDFGNLDDTPNVPIIPLPEPKPSPDRPAISFDFYGVECRVGFDQSDKIMLKDVDEDSVADMWEALSSPSYDNVMTDCIALKESLKLCDWGYYQLVKTTADKIYGARDEAVVLTAYVMANSGYKLRMGRLGTGRLCVLLGTEDGVYDCLSVTIDGEDFYLFENTDCNSIYIMKKGFPNEDGINLSINKQQKFGYSPNSERTLVSEAYRNVSASVKTNRNMIDFYDTYPCPFRKEEPGTSWVYYANAPLDSEIQATLYPTLKSAIAGKSQKEAANILLNFVQTAFEYKTDGEYWGYERPLFAAETLHYPYSDCEDRSILFSRLIRDLMNLDVVFLHYEGHLATAVAFDEDISGDHIKVNGRKYLVCDPTYINAPIGMEMPDVKLLKVIKL